MHRFLLSVVILLFAVSCKNREAAAPVYVTINDYTVETDYATEGTASSKITTVWVESNGELIGAYELPIRFPLIAEGNTNINIYPGINLNGSLALRNLYEFYKPYQGTFNLQPGDEIELESPGKDHLVTEYYESSIIEKVEDFEGAGINFTETLKSDTIIFRTDDTTEIFRQDGLNEVNLKSGKIVVPKGNSIVEFESINSFDLPKFGFNVYLEVNFKCDIPVTFGVFANEPGTRSQAPVATVNPTDEWKKIYINLVTEVSGNSNATDFSIFFGAVNTSSQEKTIYLDNLKLVY